MHSSEEGPRDASALRADVEKFTAARAAMYQTAELLDTGGVMTRNEIAAMMGEVSSRPTILDYLRDRRTIAAVNEGLRTVGLDAVFGASGPSPSRPQAQPLTLAMSLSPGELEDDPAKVFARLHRALAKHRLKIAVPPRTEPEPAAAVGMPADSSPAERLLAGGGLAHLEKMGPKRQHAVGKRRFAPLESVDLVSSFSVRGGVGGAHTAGRLPEDDAEARDQHLGRAAGFEDTASLSRSDREGLA